MAEAGPSCALLPGPSRNGLQGGRVMRLPRAAAPDPVEDLGPGSIPERRHPEAVSEVFPCGASRQGHCGGVWKGGPGHLDQARASPLRAPPVGDQGDDQDIFVSLKQQCA